MSDERLDRFEHRLDKLGVDVGVLQTDVAVMKTDVAVMKTDVAVLKTDVGGLKTDVSDLRRYMGVLHEEVLDRIRGIGEDDRLRREMQAGFAQMREMFQNHAVPGEAVDRAHSATLADHEVRISAIERT